MVFSFKIFLPAITRYQTTPHMLLRKARAGNVEAFAQLISLDKSLMQIPEIDKLIQSVVENLPGKAGDGR